MKTVKVRFAPSPTGPLHVGGLRTALYNYLFAKKNGGQFILRVEDTDQKRFVAGAEDYIMKSLYWMGIVPDEHPLNPGDCGPYRQSARKDIGLYKPYVQQLVDAGYAYYAFDTEEELESLRKRLEATRTNVGYSSQTRGLMKNSLTLPADDVKRRLEAGEPYVIRLKVPSKEEIRFQDLIRGWIMVDSKDIDDKVLMKSDGMPAYHLANVVDDHLMGITHVIRGEEWIPSAPFHVLLYKYLGWSDSMPEFAHLPLLLGPEGKLSKRDGDRLGFPVFPLSWNYTMPDGNSESITGYKDGGYNADALFNFLALMGWNPGDSQEIMSREEIIEKFDLSRVSKAGIHFDHVKLKHFQSVYFKKQDKELLFSNFKSNVSQTELADDKLRKIFDIAYERSYFEKDLYQNIDFLFKRPILAKEIVLEEPIKATLLDFINSLTNSDSGMNMKDNLFQLIKQNSLKNIQVLKPLRYILTGEEHGPELHNIFEILGSEEIAKRINMVL